MGRRKSKRNAGPKRKNIQPLDTLFNCPFCNHQRSCEVKIEKTKNTGRIQCTVCMEDFQVKYVKTKSFARRSLYLPANRGQACYSQFCSPMKFYIFRYDKNLMSISTHHSCSMNCTNQNYSFELLAGSPFLGSIFF